VKQILIGGSSDGREVDITEGRPSFDVAIPGTDKRERYNRRTIYLNAYCAEGMSDSEIDRALADRGVWKYGAAKEGEAVKAKTCIWTDQEDGTWLSECGVLWCFEADGPEENGMKFCPFCGKKLQVNIFGVVK